MRQGRLSEEVRETPYTKILEDHLVVDGIIVKGGRIVLPNTLINHVLDLSHKSHGLRESKTIRYLRTKVWFPKMADDISRYIKECFPCSISVPRKDPLHIFNRPLPARP